MQLNKSLVPTENIEPPKGLKYFFDDPPLVGNERREDYENLFLIIAKVLKPADEIEWILARDIANYNWEIKRERRIEAEIIRLKQQEVASPGLLMSRADFLREEELAKTKAENPSMFRKKEELKPQAKGEDHASGLPKAYMLGSRDIDIIDTRIASYEHRRNASLREYTQLSEAMARRREAPRDVIDGEFTEDPE
jgi:hypothetical protein